MIIKEGTIFAITCGKYSEFEVVTICRASTDFDIFELREEYLSIHPEQREDCLFKEYEFINWVLVVRCLAEELDYWTWHIGKYDSPNFRLSENRSG